MVEVINLKNQTGNIYCGRYSSYQPKYGKDFSILHNLFKLNEYDRAESLNKYRTYFRNKLLTDIKFKDKIDELMTMYKNGDYIGLGCFCKPLDCHCDIIKQHIEYNDNECEDI